MLQMFYNRVVPMTCVTDITGKHFNEQVHNTRLNFICCVFTVEDPSENFQRVRDYVDAKNCAKLECLQWAKLKEGFTKNIEDELQTKLKLNRVS